MTLDTLRYAASPLSLPAATSHRYAETPEIRSRGHTTRRVDRTPQAAPVSEPIRFEELFLAERHRLFGMLCVITGNRFDAEEIGQEAFARVWERWERVAALDDPRAYLYRVAMNLFRSRLRRASVARRHVFALDDVSDEMAKVDDRDLVARLIGNLTPRERAALVLTTMLDLPSDEVGRMLGIRGSTVRVLTTRARDRLRDAGDLGSR